MHRLALAIICLVFQAPSFSQALKPYPEKAIHLVVPFQAGGAADQMARIIADGLSETLKQPAWVENRPGATGLIGTRHVAHAAADGYTLVIGHNDSLVLHGLTHVSREPDPASGLVPIAFVGRIPGVLISCPGERHHLRPGFDPAGPTGARADQPRQLGTGQHHPPGGGVDEPDRRHPVAACSVWGHSRSRLGLLLRTGGPGVCDGRDGRGRSAGRSRHHPGGHLQGTGAGVERYSLAG